MYGKIQKSGLIEIIPLMRPQASVLCARILSLLQVHGCGGGWVVDSLVADILLLSWVPSELTIKAVVMWWFDGCNIFIYSIQVTCHMSKYVSDFFFFTHKIYEMELDCLVHTITNDFK